MLEQLCSSIFYLIIKNKGLNYYMHIETKRVIIKKYTENDFDDYYSYIMNKELQKLLGVEYINDFNSAYENFQGLMENREFLAIYSKCLKKIILN